MIALIVLGGVVVIIVICIIIWLKNKKASSRRRSSILSTPDAMMIADTFRQVMTNPTDNRNQIGQDILNRQLISEGMSVSEIERRTSSTKNNKK